LARLTGRRMANLHHHSNHLVHLGLHLHHVAHHVAHSVHQAVSGSTLAVATPVAHVVSGFLGAPGAEALSYFHSSVGGAGADALFLAAVLIGATVVLYAAFGLVRIGGDYCASTERVSFGILDNWLTVLVFAVGGIFLAAHLGGSTGDGMSLFHGIFSGLTSHLGPVGGGGQ